MSGLQFDWGNEHEATCLVTKHRAEIADVVGGTLPESHGLSADTSLGVLSGIVLEYTSGGDQEGELCNCSTLYNVEWLVGLYGNNPQEVGVDHEIGNEDDYGDLLGDAARVLGLLGEDDYERVSIIASDLDRYGIFPTTMAAWIEEIRARLN